MDRRIRPSEVSRRVQARSAAAIAVAAWLGIHLVPASAQTPPELRNANIALDYFEPRKAEFVPLYERLQQRRVLEELSQFLAPVRWPRKLRLIMKQCPAS